MVWSVKKFNIIKQILKGHISRRKQLSHDGQLKECFSTATPGVLLHNSLVILLNNLYFFEAKSSPLSEEWYGSRQTNGLTLYDSF